MVENIDGIKYDHENVALFCDPNYSTPHFFFTIEKGPYSPRRRCLYGRDVFEYVFEYSKKFLETYKNEKKIFKMGFNDAHESTGEVIRYMDESLKNFIEYYLKNHMTEKSMIIFLSDHGNAMPDLNEFLLSQDKEIEKTLGMLFLIYPELNVKNDSLYNNTALLLNEQTLVTPYEIYATLLDNLGFNDTYYNKEKSSPLDKEIDKSKRTCELYYDDFKFYSTDMKLCRCKNINS
jgi:phosphoglycerol transferase MdoB-like AlkP superfamily enzyme